MTFSIKDFFSKYDQIRRKLRIWSHLLKKSLMENFIFVQCSIRILILLRLKHGEISNKRRILSCGTYQRALLILNGVSMVWRLLKSGAYLYLIFKNVLTEI